MSFRAWPFLSLSFFKVKSRSVFIQSNKYDDFYALLEMGVPVVQANFPSA